MSFNQMRLNRLRCARSGREAIYRV